MPGDGRQQQRGAGARRRRPAARGTAPPSRPKTGRAGRRRLPGLPDARRRAVGGCPAPPLPPAPSIPRAAGAALRGQPERRLGAAQARAASGHVTAGPSAASSPRSAASSALRRPGPSGSGIITTASPPTAAPTAPGPEPAREPRGDPVDQLLARPRRAVRGGEALGLVGLGRHDRGEQPRQRPARGLGGGPHRLGVGRRLLHEQPQQPPAAALALARGLRLRLGEARRGLGRDLVDVGEHRLAEVVERVGREAGARAGVDEPPPRQPRADAVGGQQRVQRAALAVLARAEPLVGVARAADLAPSPTSRSTKRLSAIWTPKRTVSPKRPSIGRA